MQGIVYKSAHSNIEVPFLFIVGRPRSGTTLLRTIFDAHPHVCIPPECHLIINLHPRYGKIRQWDEKTILPFYDDLKKQWLFDTWNIKGENLRSDLLKMAGENTFGNICKLVYASHESLFAKKEIRLFGDKNPGYAIYTEKLLKIFPEAKFIHIIRDYRDNYVSVRDVDFELPIPSLVVKKWKNFVKRFNRAMEKHPKNHRVIRYEDLAADPEYHIRQLCDFTGITFLPEMLEFHNKKDMIEESRAHQLVKKYHKSLMHRINTGRIGLWQKQLSIQTVKIADITAGKTAELAGYERKYKSFNPGIYLLALPGIMYAQLLILLTKIVDRFPYKLRMKILNEWPWRIAKLYLRVFKRDAI
ncbi:MAG: sulfotransferase [Bacteroidota bacterium]|nr:sulfotransferase [Bacteroidota bacterium]